MKLRGTIALFGHNSNDAAVRRRAVAFRRAGYRVIGFMPHRGEKADKEWELVELGATEDNAYLKRVASIFSGARLASRSANHLRSADMIYARNLDMLALAVRARHLCKLNTPVVYECLDVHHKLTGDSRTAKVMRGLERWLLSKCAALVVSSPRFESEHFAKHYPGLYTCTLIENRLIEGDGFPPRPAPRKCDPTQPLRIGWFGNLRCSRSLGLLIDLARKFPDDVRITLRGYHAQHAIPDFEEQVRSVPNLTYEGRYEAPHDLAEIYGGVDLIWAGDWYEAGANSLWLLPNRVYEGGYFGTPALAPSGTQTAHWLATKAGGFFLDEPVAASLEATVVDLLQNRAPIDTMYANLLELPRSVFVESPETVQSLFAAVTSARAEHVRRDQNL